MKITNLYFKRRRKKRRNEKIKHVMQHVYESGFRNLSEEEHFLKHLLFLGRCASFNPTNFRNVLISFVHVREREERRQRRKKYARHVESGNGIEIQLVASRREGGNHHGWRVDDGWREMRKNGVRKSWVSRQVSEDTFDLAR